MTSQPLIRMAQLLLYKENIHFISHPNSENMQWMWCWWYKTGSHLNMQNRLAANKHVMEKWDTHLINVVIPKNVIPGCRSLGICDLPLFFCLHIWIQNDDILDQDLLVFPQEGYVSASIKGGKNPSCSPMIFSLFLQQCVFAF